MTAANLLQPSALPAARAEASVGEARLRLGAAAVVLLALATFIIGTAWDIQWHPSVGRDRLLTLPHQAMLAGITLSGLASLALVLLDSLRARRGSGVHDGNSTRILGIFRAPIGFILAGFGALVTALAFPLDDYWHVLYGIDVTLWAPFHVMIMGGMAMVGFGALYALASELNRLPDGRARSIARLLFSLGVALTLATIMLMLPQANDDEGLILLAGREVVLYPAMLAGMSALGLVVSLWGARRAGAATLMALAFFLLRGLLFWFVPGAMAFALEVEGYSLRPNAPESVILAFSYPWSLLPAALVTDLAYSLARRGGREGTALWIAAAAAVGMTFLDRPWASVMTSFYFPNLDVQAAFWNAFPLTLLAAVLGTAVALLIRRGLDRTVG